MNIFLLSLDNEVGKERRKKINYDYTILEETRNTKLENVPDIFISRMRNLHNIKDNYRRAKSCHFDAYYNLLIHIYENKIDNVIICEDDAILLNVDNLNKLKSLNLTTPVLLNGQLHHPTNYSKDNKTYFNNNLLPIINNFNPGINKIDYNKFRWSCCACIYYPDHKYIKKILDCMENDKWITTLDLWLSKKKFITHLYYPAPFIIKDSNISQVNVPRGTIDNYKLYKNK
jgi:hypothetical protein